MRLPEEQEERGTGTPVTYMIIGVSVIILIILAAVLVSNNQKPAQNRIVAAAATPQPAQSPEITFSEEEADIETLYRENKLRAEDLDIWDMYKRNEPEVVAEPTSSPTPEPSHEPTEEEKAADGKHTLVSYKDGTQEWLEISEDIPLHTYDFTKMKSVNGKMTYYEGNQKLSYLGVDLSKTNGTVDFETLKSNGVDFVMLLIGSRGYESGLISLDENFVANITEAQRAGLEVGVYFQSQAVTVEEAVEEAKFVTDNLIPYRISYPVAYKMEPVKNDTSRIDYLDTEQKTRIAEAFLSTVEREGYHTILYGNKQWLLTELLWEEILPDYEVWLNDKNPLPDYPYQFKMWEYAGGETTAGVSTPVNYTISFVDYSRR